MYWTSGGCIALALPANRRRSCIKEPNKGVEFLQLQSGLHVLGSFMVTNFNGEGKTYGVLAKNCSRDTTIVRYPKRALIDLRSNGERRL
jgi:hypothetical protein